MTPFNGLASVRRIDNPALKAIRACVDAHAWVGRPINRELLGEVSAALAKATCSPCVAFHECELVPGTDGMVRVRLSHSSGPWVLTVFRLPSPAEGAP